MKRVIATISALALLCFALTGCGGTPTTTPSQSTTQNQNTETQNSTKTTNPYASGTHHAIMKIKGYGQLKLELYSDVAPKTVEEFASLVQKKYYNKKTIYALINDLYVKLGDASGKTAGKYLVPGEYKDAGVTNTISLKQGVLAMSRTKNGKQSDASSLIIFLSDVSYLDGKYAAFGKVTQGIDILDNICSQLDPGTTGQKVSKNGTISKKKYQPVITSIEMVD